MVIAMSAPQFSSMNTAVAEDEKPENILWVFSISGADISIDIAGEKHPISIEEIKQNIIETQRKEEERFNKRIIVSVGLERDAELGVLLELEEAVFEANQDLKYTAAPRIIRNKIGY